jgi:hypothetical protein
VFLPESQQGVEQQERGDDRKIAPVPHDEGHHCGGLDHPGDGPPEVSEKRRKAAFLLFRERVWPVLIQTLLDVSRT